VKHRWARLFTPPPPPSFIPAEVFAKKMHDSFESRFADTKALVDKLRARGGKIVFVRFPMGGDLKTFEDQTTPRGPTWDRLLKETAAPDLPPDIEMTDSQECGENRQKGSGKQAKLPRVQVVELEEDHHRQ